MLHARDLSASFVGFGTTRKKEGRNVEPNANGRVDSWERVARIVGISESSSAFSHHSAPLVIRVQSLERQVKLEILHFWEYSGRWLYRLGYMDLSWERITLQDK